MGELIFIEAKHVRPSQDYLKEGTLGYILRCYANHKEDELPPPPMVRLDPETNEYVAIDGHNLLAIDGLLDKKTKVYVANSPDDKITIGQSPTSSPDALAQRNADLEEKFDQCLLDAKSLNESGLSSFSSLRAKYDFLTDVTAAHKHYEIQ